MANTKNALEAEVLNAPVTFTFEGVKYTVPNAKNWPLTVVRAQENGKMVGAIEILLGPKQSKAFDPDGTRTISDLENLLKALFDASEIDPKE
jgi:hypothetical protein